MDDRLRVRDAGKASVNLLVRDIHTLRAILIGKKKLRGRQKGAFMSELHEYFEWLFILEYELREKVGVANRDSKQTAWRGFVDVKMTEGEKEEFTSWDVHDEDLFLLLSQTVAEGHKMSLTFNKQNETFVCSFTGNEGTGKHEGYTLSAYAGDWYLAVRALVFKHVVLLDSAWEKAAERPSERIG